MNYFHGKGFYAEAQNPKTKPNILDTRQSFLMKMHDPVMRKNFIETYKRFND